MSAFVIATGAGRAFDFEAPAPGMIERRALAQALAMESRWANNLHLPYSVAQHSLLVAERIAEPAWRIYGLLHDAPKAFTRDLPTPFKRLMAAAGFDIFALEARIMAAVWAHFSLPAPTPEAEAAVAEADARALATEWRDVVKGRIAAWSPAAKPWRQVIRPLPWTKVEELFLDRLEAYLGAARATDGSSAEGAQV